MTASITAGERIPAYERLKPAAPIVATACASASVASRTSTPGRSCTQGCYRRLLRGQLASEALPRWLLQPRQRTCRSPGVASAGNWRYVVGGVVGGPTLLAPRMRHAQEGAALVHGAPYEFVSLRRRRLAARAEALKRKPLSGRLAAAVGEHPVSLAGISKREREDETSKASLCVGAWPGALCRGNCGIGERCLSRRCNSRSEHGL